MDMEAFYRHIRPRIIIDSFDDRAFRRVPLQFRERSVNTGDMRDWYTPWYYRREEEVSLNEATINDQSVHAMRLSEVPRLSRDLGRNRDIACRPVPFWPVPVATDTETGRTLVLDGNRTLAAMLIRRMHQDVPVVEILGRRLASIIGSFAIVNH